MAADNVYSCRLTLEHRLIYVVDHHDLVSLAVWLHHTD
jgi:Txe/YoeB family toxin of Txe-Axe toxin-antitoxin module